MPRADPLLIVSALFLAAVAWLIARAVRQNGVLVRVGASPAPAGSMLPSVTVVVPARNEAAIVAAMAAADARVTLLAAPALPRGWKGKAHACWYGAQTVPADPEWLCFLDADVRAHPFALAGAVQLAQAGALDLLSLAPRHELGSFAERLIIPCGMYILGFSMDQARIQAPDSGEALCTGQFMLVRRGAYEQVGGYAMVRDSICEDLDFARLLKRNGRKVRLEDGSAVLVTRMYTGWGTLWPGFAKNIVDMLGGPARTLLIAVSAIVLSWSAVILRLID